MAKFLNCSPRFFTAAQDVTLGRLLEFYRDAWGYSRCRSYEGVAPRAPEA